MSSREAAVFAAIAEAVVAPVPPLPAVAQTDAVQYFDRLLLASPAPNRAGLKLALRALDAAPRLARRGGRLRALPAAERVAFLQSLERRAPLRPLVRAVSALAQLSYYGDDGVMRRLGYDPEANLARARAVRAAEARW
jgi:hypothetical protein